MVETTSRSYTPGQCAITHLLPWTIPDAPGCTFAEVFLQGLALLGTGVQVHHNTIGGPGVQSSSGGSVPSVGHCYAASEFSAEDNGPLQARQRYLKTSSSERIDGNTIVEMRMEHPEAEILHRKKRRKKEQRWWKKRKDDRKKAKIIEKR